MRSRAAAAERLRSTRDQIAAQSLLTCYGYGQSQPPALGSSSYKPLAHAGDQSLINFGAIAAFDFEAADSGAPCLDSVGQVATIHRSVLLSPAETHEEAAPGFRQFALDVINSLVAAHGDVNGNGKDEFVFIKTTNIAGIDFYDIKVLWDDGTTVSLTTPIQTVIGALDKLMLGIGNFNGDKKVVGTQSFDYDDLVFGVGNKFVYYRGSDTGLIAQTAFELLDSSVSYKDMYVRDFDGDNRADLELVRDDSFSQRDIYFGSGGSGGSSGGLSKGESFIGAPVDDPQEGRFSMITGPQEFTYPVTYHDFLFWIPKTASRTRIQVFDGYFGSRYDFGVGRACYRLYASKLAKDDPTDSSVKPVLVAGVPVGRDSLNLKAHEWDVIYDGPHVADALDSNGDYYVYLLRAQVGGCDGTAQALGANAFMLRANGSVGVLDGGIYARDRSGPAAVADSGLLGLLPDTSYDGTFTFFYASQTASEKLYLRDADADNSTDEDHPGFEVIKSPVVYTMTGPGGALVTNNNPSGQYAPSANQPKDVEEFLVNPFSVGMWTQQWSKLLQGNMVFVGSYVKGSPEIPVLRLVRPEPLPTVSCARDVAWWVSNQEIATFLPVTIGAGAFLTQLQSADAVRAALSESILSVGGTTSNKTSVCHKPDKKLLHLGKPAIAAHLAHGDDELSPSAQAVLVAELVAAKLNVHRAELLGEPLTTAHVYGRVIAVSSALADADSLVRTGDEICIQSKAYSEAVARATMFLQAINAGEVTYLAPRIYSPPVSTAGGAQAGLVLPGL